LCRQDSTWGQTRRPAGRATDQVRSGYQPSHGAGARPHRTAGCHRPRRRGDRMKRRQFITLLGGAAAWPLAARAQPGERTRRIGVLMSTAAGDAEGRARIAAFLDELKKLGWIDGRTARIDMRWPASTQEVRRYSAELVGLASDVLLATGSAGLSDLLETTRTVPIVFVNVGDPVGGGFVESLARP